MYDRANQITGWRTRAEIVWSSLETTFVPSVNVFSMQGERPNTGIGCAREAFWTAARVAAG